MSVVVVNRIHRGFYLDSVALMRHSRAIAGMAGVEEAALMMATPANREIMADAGLLSPEADAAEGGDLIIGIRVTGDKRADAALAAADRLLEQRATGGGGDSAWRPRTIRGAVRVAPDANLALISVPGAFAGSSKNVVGYLSFQRIPRPSILKCNRGDGCIWTPTVGSM